MLDLVSSCPAPIRHSRARGSRSAVLAARDRLEDVERRREADAFVDRHGRVLEEEVARVQHKTALGRPVRPSAPARHPHGSATGSGPPPGRPRAAPGDREADMRRRLIHDDAHRAFGRVGAHVDHAACEAIVAHRRHRDQHLPVEIAALRAALLPPRAARRPRSCRFGAGMSILVGEEPASSRVPVLRVNFMSKCYLIAGQTTRRLNHASFVPQFVSQLATIRRASGDMCRFNPPFQTSIGLRLRSCSR